MFLPAQRESSASIRAAPTPYRQAEPATAQKILEFDCRGLEFTEFMPEVSTRTPRDGLVTNRSSSAHFILAEQGEWLADGSGSGSKFTGVELVDGEWFDYDEKAGEEVSIRDVRWEIRRA